MDIFISVILQFIIMAGVAWSMYWANGRLGFYYAIAIFVVYSAVSIMISTWRIGYRDMMLLNKDFDIATLRTKIAIIEGQFIKMIKESKK